MFPKTAKARKRLWICSLARKIGKDIQPIQSSHVESIVKLVRKSNRKSKPDTYVKLSLDMKDYYRIKDAEGGTRIEGFFKTNGNGIVQLRRWRCISKCIY